MNFFLIAGEPSGDRLGAALIQGFDKRLSYPADFIAEGAVRRGGQDAGQQPVAMDRGVPVETAIEGGRQLTWGAGIFV